MDEASVWHLAAAARAKGEPYFTGWFVNRLEQLQVDGVVLAAVLEAAEQVTEGSDTHDARRFLDDLFQDLSSEHKNAAKQILREWMAAGVPKPIGQAVNTTIHTMSPIPGVFPRPDSAPVSVL